MYHRSYHERVLKSDTPKQKKTRIKWKSIAIGVGTAALISALVVIIRAPRLQVTEVVVEGAQVADPFEVSQFVLGTLDGTYLRIFPKTSIVLISPDTLTQSIARAYPRFKSVAVDRASMQKLVVSVEEYPGVYLWCDTTDACSFMDAQGTVFADAPYFSGSAYLKVYGGTRSPYPFTAFNPTQMQMIATLSDKLPGIDIEPLSVSFVSDKTVVVRFVHNQREAQIRFDPTTPIDAQLDILYSGLRTQPLSRLYHDRAQVLEYLDVRFDNKLVYKFQ